MPQNLFKIYDGRNYFWQWDTNQKLIVLDETVDEVHFSNRDMTHAIPKDVCIDKDGKRVCYIPDVLLTLPKNLVASAYVTDDNATKTLRSVKFAVRQRPIPADYVTNEDLQFEDFTERLGIIEDIIEDSCLVQRFSAIEDAERWAKESKDAGAIISVNTGTQWETYIVEDDYNITPISCDEEAIMRDIEALRQLVGNSSITNQIEQYILNLDLPNAYDAKGSAAQALADAKEYVKEASSSMQAKLDEEVERAQYEEAAITETLFQVNDRAGRIQDDVDKLEALVGQLPNGSSAKTIVEYIDAKTETTASKGLQVTVSRNSNGHVIVDKTHEEIHNAVLAGSYVYMTVGNTVYIDGYSLWPNTVLQLVYCSNDSASFMYTSSPSEYVIEIDSSNSVTTYSGHALPAQYSYANAGMVLTVGEDGIAVPADFPDTIARISDLEEVKALVGDQSDWNVNDEVSGAYIKNKPFYDSREDVELFNGQATSIYSATLPEHTYNIDSKYVVIFDGTKYELSFQKTTKPTQLADGEYYYLGSPAYFNGTPYVTNDNEYPFCITTFSDSLENVKLMIITKAQQRFPVDVQVIEKSGELKQIDAKYLPDGAMTQADWYVHDETNNAYIKNRTHYAIDRELLASFVMSIASANSYSVDDALSSDVIRSYINGGNSTVDVFIDGVLYKCQAIFTKGHYYINLDGSTNTEQGLRIYIGGNTPNMIYLHPESFGLDMSADTRMVEVCTSEVLKQLDPKYIKDIYYEKDPVEIIIADNITPMTDSDDMPRCTFVVGDKYKVIWNGITYECVCYDYEGWRVLGAPNDDCPFYIDDDGGNSLYINGENDDDLWIVSIVHVKQEVHKIAPKYIKDMYYEEEDIFTSGTINEPGFRNDSYKLTNLTKSFVEGEEYIVRINGKEYSAVCEFDDDGSGNQFLYLGAYPPLMTEESWFSVTLHVASNNLMAYVHDSTRCPVTIEVLQKSVHQIDAKYLSIVEYDVGTVFEGTYSAGEYRDKKYKMLLGEHTVVVDDVSVTVKFIEGAIASHASCDLCEIETMNGAICFSFPDDNPHDIKIIGSKQVIKKEYLPKISSEQSDWNQNDSTASDYVKNRTHWDESFTLDVSKSDDSYNFNSDFGFLRVSTNPDDFPNDIEGLIVEYNDVVYSNVTHNNWPAHNAAVYSIEVDDVEYDVAVVVRQENTDITVYKGGTRYRITNPGIGVWVIYDPGVSSRATAKIYTNNVHPLDEKYIPNTIARTSQIDSKMNKLNPVGTGSLSMNRKSGSSEGISSTTLGYNGSASGQYALAEGAVTSASGYASHAEGYNTNATRHAQHVEGQFNILDTEGTTKGKYVHIVGNGTALDARSNAHTIDWNGLGWFKDGVKVGGTGQDDATAKFLATKEYVDTIVNQITGVSSLPGVRVAEVSLLSANWVGDASPYSQVLELEGITEYSQVDLKPNIQQLAIFHDKDLAFVTENEDGVVTCYVLGDKPKDDYVMQVAITEVIV